MYSLFVFTILYTIILLSSYHLAKNVCCKNNVWKSSSIYIILLSFSLIVGLRWNVGADYLSYYSLYKGNYLYDTELSRIELLPRLLMLIYNKFNLPFYFWFITMAYLQIYFVIKAMIKGFTKYLPISMLFFLALFLKHDMNIIRQGVAYSIVFYSMTFLSNRQRNKYIIYIIAATLFHKSAFILLPFVLINFSKIKINLFIQILIYISSIFLGSRLIDFITSNSSVIMTVIWGIEKYERMLGNDLLDNVNSGYGVLLLDSLCLIVIIFSNRILKLHSNIKPFYWMFFIGACLYHSAMRQQYFLRIDLYFLFSIILLLSLVFYDIKNKAINSFIVFGGLCMAIMSALTLDWSFVWD